MVTKLKDLAVQVGTYTQNGVTKNRYKNVGALMQGDNGQFIFLDASFNPAGISRKEGSESIIISMFDVRSENQAQPTQTQQTTYKQPDMTDDVPF